MSFVNVAVRQSTLLSSDNINENGVNYFTVLQWIYLLFCEQKIDGKLLYTRGRFVDDN